MHQYWHVRTIRCRHTHQGCILRCKQHDHTGMSTTKPIISIATPGQKDNATASYIHQINP